jgi:hypothetical protein
MSKFFPEIARAYERPAVHQGERRFYDPGYPTTIARQILLKAYGFIFSRNSFLAPRRGAGARPM